MLWHLLLRFTSLLRLSKQTLAFDISLLTNRVDPDELALTLYNPTAVLSYLASPSPPSEDIDDEEQEEPHPGGLAELARGRFTPDVNEKGVLESDTVYTTAVLQYLEFLPRTSEDEPTTPASPIFGDLVSRRFSPPASDPFGDQEEPKGEWGEGESDTSSLSYGEVRPGGSWLEGGGGFSLEQWGAQQLPRQSEDGKGDRLRRYESYESSFGNIRPLPNFNAHSSPPRSVWSAHTVDDVMDKGEDAEDGLAQPADAVMDAGEDARKDPQVIMEGDTEPVSEAELLALRVLAKELSQFNTEISPWTDPQQWHVANMAHIQSTVRQAGIEAPLKGYITLDWCRLMIYPINPTLHARDAFAELFALDVVDLSAQLTILLMDTERYKTLVACCDDSAQSVLNFLQARLDYPIDYEFKPRHLSALVKLSEHSRRYPECLLLQGITLPAEAASGGSFGDVYRCKMQEHDFAVKVLKVYIKSDMKEILKSFAREAVIWRQLSHPNVLPFYGVFRLGSQYERLCLVCPWMSNGNLSEYLHGMSPQRYCVPLALDVAEGLTYLHSQNIVHADLKCANILVSHALRACLADFGLSLAKDTASVNFTSSSMRTRGTVGTLNWTGPELLPDHANPESTEYERRRPDQASDVYSLAMVCYEIFSGCVPFKGRKDHQIINAISRGMRPKRPVDLRSQTRGLTDSIWKIIETCWHQFPQQRFSASQAVQRFRSLPGLPVDKRPLDDYNMPAALRTTYTQAQHPFAVLKSDVEQAHDQAKATSINGINIGDIDTWTVPLTHREKPLPARPSETNDSVSVPSQRPEPVPHSKKIRKGLWNKRGDHLTSDMCVVFAPANREYPPELESYPDEGEGYWDAVTNQNVPWIEDRPEFPPSLPHRGRPPAQPYDTVSF
ncbi:hypothetical protein HWV62_9703 [Athelia sp. TMB]|nr:hypothetical protein HWV62_9703 [Athelia sp. TMB]